MNSGVEYYFFHPTLDFIEPIIDEDTSDGVFVLPFNPIYLIMFL